MCFVYFYYSYLCIVKFNKNALRKIVLPFFLAAYLFVTLFSQHFHHHNSGLYFKQFNFVKTGKYFSESKIKLGDTDCLICHFAQDGNTLLPENFPLDLARDHVFSKQLFVYKQNFYILSREALSVRGPPSFI